MFTFSIVKKKMYIYYIMDSKGLQRAGSEVKKLITNKRSKV